MSLAELQNLSGRTALVTGGSRGLGLQMAEVLGELGARVAITARKKHELDEAAAHLAARGITALPIVCDMSNLDGIPPMVDEVVAALGDNEIHVNKTGTPRGGAADGDKFWCLFRVTVRGKCHTGDGFSSPDGKSR